MAKAKYEDARLLLQLYDLRREALLRRARQWFLTQFSAYNWEEYQRKYLPGSEEERMIRMVTSYWNMAASIVRAGAIDQQLFFQNNAEMLQVWEKVKPWIEGARMEIRPSYLQTLESVVADYTEWLEKMNAKYAIKRKRTIPTAPVLGVTGPAEPAEPVLKRKRGRPKKRRPRGRPRKRR
ncbi:MAG: hypothetical protein N3A72_09970 [bacterium]|nr:hypothetical protein [bacterium]